MNRRTLLKIATLTGATGLLPLPELLAKTKTSPNQELTGGFKRFKLGELELTVITDGHIISKPVQPFMAPKAPAAEVKKILEANFRPTDFVDLAMNILIVRSKDKLVLLDTGMGIFANETQGWLIKSLEQAGFSINDITDVLLSHAHPDHLGGLINKQNNLVFPNANIHIAKIEYDFWVKATVADFSKSELRKQADFLKQIIAGIQNVLTVIKPKLNFFDFNKSLYEHFSFQLAPGHTPGLTMITVASGNEKLIYIADLIHSDVLLFAHPEWGFSGDTDLELASATRRKMLQQLADSKTKTLAYHLPWPGLGNVAVKDAAFTWIPEVFATP